MSWARAGTPLSTSGVPPGWVTVEEEGGALAVVSADETRAVMHVSDVECLFTTKEFWACYRRVAACDDRTALEYDLAGWVGFENLAEAWLRGEDLGTRMIEELDAGPPGEPSSHIG